MPKLIPENIEEERKMMPDILSGPSAMINYWTRQRPMPFSQGWFRPPQAPPPELFPETIYKQSSYPTQAELAQAYANVPPPVPPEQPKPQLTPPATTATPKPTTPSLTPEELMFKQAREEAQKYAAQRGVLPWDFFMRYPGVTGGVLRMEEGPQAGKVFVGLERPPDINDTFRKLMMDYLTRINDLLEKPPVPGAPERGPAYMADLLHQLANAYSTYTGTTKVPSEILKNITEAQRAQIIPNVYSGEPGSLASYILRPGGQPEPFARGATESKLALGENKFANQLMLDLAKKAVETIWDPLIPEEAKKEARNILGYVLGSSGTMQQQVIDYPTFYAEAKRLNPNASDELIRRKYEEKFGRGK